MERWKGVFLCIALGGLVIGWFLKKPLAGLAFIWIAMLVAEALLTKRGEGGG